MSQPLVSIIIPFFNEENYLERAVDSALAQTYTQIEIILINDGSTDGSQARAAKYESQYESVKLITTENLGLSSARNTGLAHADGAYIAYLDADDAFEPDAISCFVEVVAHTGADLVISRFTLHDKQGRSFREAGWQLEDQPIDGVNAVEKMYTGGIASVAWAKFYRREAFKDLRFPVGLWFEDRPYVLECLLLSQKIGFVEKSLLNVYAKENSITRRTVTEKRIKDLYAIYLREIDILAKHDKVDELAAYVINHHIDVLLDSFFLLLIDDQRMTDAKKCKAIFLEYLAKFNKQMISYPRALNVKRKIALLMLNGLRLLPWRLMAMGIAFTFRKKYAGIKILKNS